MQAIAREMNLSETTFILPGDQAEEAREGVRVRIFTTEEELPFAGHPTLGTASWLWWNHPTLRGADQITLRLNAGAVPVTFELPGAEDAVFGTMKQLPPVFGQSFTPEEVAPALGCAIEDLEPGWPTQIVSTGNPFAIVPFRSVEALSRLAIPQAESQRWLKEKGARWFYCLAPAPEGGGGLSVQGAHAVLQRRRSSDGLSGRAGDSVAGPSRAGTGGGAGDDRSGCRDAAAVTAESTGLVQRRGNHGRVCWRSHHPKCRRAVPPPALKRLCTGAKSSNPNNHA